MINKKLKKEFHELKEEFAKYGGIAETLRELKEVSNYKELQKYIKTKEKQFWNESTIIAQKLCDKNIEMAKDYMKND